MNSVTKSIIAVCLLLPATAAAQSRTAIAISGGASSPIGRLGEAQEKGVDFSLGLVRGSDDSPVGFRFDLGYDKFPGKTVAGVKNPDRRVVDGTANLVFSMSGYRFKPYAFGGAGAFKLSSGAGATAAKTRFGFDFGVGFTMPLGSRALFVESRLNSISQNNAKPLRYYPLVVGMLF